MALRHGFNQDADGALKISGIMSAGGFEVFDQYKMDYDDDFDLVDGTVTLSATFNIKQIHLMNTADVDIIVSFEGAAAAGNRLRLVGGAAITLDLDVSDVRLTATADDAAYAYVLIGDV